MSAELVKRVWELELPAHQADVLEKLAWFADDAGENCFPGNVRLAWILRRSERAIRYALRELLGEGLIEVSQNASGGRGRIRGYTLHLAKGETRVPFIAKMGEGGFRVSVEKEEVGDRKGEVQRLKGEVAFSARDREVLILENSIGEQERPKRTWEPPGWFSPLTTLEGYRRLNYSKLAAKLVGICEAAQVTPGDVVQAFAEYWPVGRLRHRNWNSPTGALDRTIDVQISKLKGGSWNGARPPQAGPSRGDHAPAEYAQAKRDYDERVRRAQQETPT